MPAIQTHVAPNARPGIVINLVTALFPLAITVAGAFLLLHAGPRLIEGLSASNWAEAQGRVIAAEVAEIDMGGRGPGAKRWFEVHVAYVLRLLVGLIEANAWVCGLSAGLLRERRKWLRVIRQVVPYGSITSHRTYALYARPLDRWRYMGDGMRWRAGALVRIGNVRWIRSRS